MRVWISSLIVSVIAVGCATADSEITGEQGVAELRVDAAPFAGSVTRITVEAAGRIQDLPFNPNTGSFDGTLFLPAGSQSLVASAFLEDTLVAQSRPTAVDITIGGVTRVMIRLLDLSVQGPQRFGPIIDSVSFPTTAEAGASITLAATAVAPSNEPVFYVWGSDCADASFSASLSPTTTWTKPTPGTCTIVLTVTSNGFSVGQTIAVVVFPSGTSDGAVAVSTAFVSAPQPFLSLPRLGCDVTLTSNGSCPQIIASPTATPYQLTVFTWGNSSPGTLALSDNCGGTFGTSQRSSDAVIGFWLPPVAGGLCILTAQAVNDDGLSSTVSAAVVTRPGTVATAQPPQIGVSIDGGCFVAAPGAPADCGDIQIGSTRSLFGSVGWQDGFPGSVTITDDCVGRRPDPEFTSSFFASWIVASSPGTTCTLTVHATSLEGSSSDAVARYHVVAAPTR